MYLTKLSEEAKATIQLGYQNHHRFFPILQMQGEIDQPVTNNDFIYEKYLDQDCTVPSWALRRYDLVKSAGIPIKQVIIGHEYTYQLPAPKVMPKPVTTSLKEAGQVALPIIGEVFVMTMKMMFVLSGALLAGLAIGIDPQLNIVLDDEKETWICLASWQEL